MGLIEAAPLFSFRQKKPEFYKGIRSKTDFGLHTQLAAEVGNLIDPQRFVIEHGRKPRVLDIGCGEGALSQRLFDLGFDVLSIDVDESSFRANGPIFRKINLDLPTECETLFAERKHGFDLIVTAEVIEHVRDPWKFLEMIKVISQPHTIVIVTTPNISSCWNRIWFLFKGEFLSFGRDAWDSMGHINPINHIEFTSICRDLNIEVVKCWPGGHLPVIWFETWKSAFFSILMCPLYFMMRGPKKGWVSCYNLKIR